MKIHARAGKGERKKFFCVTCCGASIALGRVGWGLEFILAFADADSKAARILDGGRAD